MDHLKEDAASWRPGINQWWQVSGRARAHGHGQAVRRGEFPVVRLEQQHILSRRRKRDGWLERTPIAEGHGGRSVRVDPFEAEEFREWPGVITHRRGEHDLAGRAATVSDDARPFPEFFSFE